MKVGKIWGITEVLVATPLFAMHRLTILPKCRCSRHEHTQKWNAFLVLSGTLHIDVAKNAYDLIDTTTLTKGEFTTVAPGERHWFRTGDEGCIAVEMYYLGPLAEDIIRYDTGTELNDDAEDTDDAPSGVVRKAGDYKNQEGSR